MRKSSGCAVLVSTALVASCTTSSGPSSSPPTSKEGTVIEDLADHVFAPEYNNFE